MAKQEGAQSQVRDIAKAVATAFALAGLTSQEVAPRQIIFTDLPWTTPPLISKLQLHGIPIQGYLNVPVNVEQQALMDFWADTLHDMWFTPGECMKQGVFTRLTKTLPVTRRGVRSFRFSEPTGYPRKLDVLCGVMLSLEAAHTAYVSLPISDLVFNDSNYYVVFKDGSQIGVRNGKPVTASPWEYDASGMIRDLLEMPRGASNHICDYDQIAAVRSLMHEYQEKFEGSFDALDLLLQALRYLTMGANCPDLLVAMRYVPEDISVTLEKARILGEAIDVMRSDIPDRSKLHTLESILVPSLFGMGKFRRCIFASPTYPFTMEKGKSARILSFLEDLYRELPCNQHDTA